MRLEKLVDHILTRGPSLNPNQRPVNGGCSDSNPPEPAGSSSKGKNLRRRASCESDEEPCAAPPLKKRATMNRRPPSTARPSPVAKRAPSRRSTRNISRSAKKEVSELADPDPDVIVIDDDGYPYVAYDDAPHLHPPPQRYKKSKSAQPLVFYEKVKGCVIALLPPSFDSC